MQTRRSGGGIFLILIPILIVIISFLYDNAIIIVSNKNYRETTESIIREVLTNSYVDKESIVIKEFEDRKLETEQLDVRYEDEVLYVYNVHNYPSFFGKVFGVNSYRIEVDLKAYKKDGVIKIEENKED